VFGRFDRATVRTPLTAVKKEGSRGSAPVAAAEEGRCEPSGVPSRLSSGPTFLDNSQSGV